jgi:hypothetical protein
MNGSPVSGSAIPQGDSVGARSTHHERRSGFRLCPHNRQDCKYKYSIYKSSEADGFVSQFRKRSSCLPVSCEPPPDTCEDGNVAVAP